ncbi:hypothetical protein Fmac_031038 [Flemingia macrophylla]|uniref:Uncharacterized protein n=1 Tax=Flemingia macrophylla TaxID=520843 RepID=A0ABD1L0X0_9FABA
MTIRRIDYCRLIHVAAELIGEANLRSYIVFTHLELVVVGLVHLDLKARKMSLLAPNKSARLVTKRFIRLISYLLMALLITKHASSALTAKEP